MRPTSPSLILDGCILFTLVFFNLPGSEYFVDSFKLYEIMHAAENVSTIV